MSDQAQELRRLARRHAADIDPGAAPRLIAVAGGKKGVGTTTLAFNLAVALCAGGRRGVSACLTGLAEFLAGSRQN